MLCAVYGLIREMRRKHIAAGFFNKQKNKSMELIKTVLNRLEKAKSKLDSATGTVEAMLVDKCDFDPTVSFQPSDGWVVGCDFHDIKLAPLEGVFSIIDAKGFCSKEDYLNICI